MGSIGSDINRIKDWLSLEGGSSGGNPNPIDVSKIKDTSLQSIESRIRNLKHEELYAYDSNGNLISGYKGNGTSVGFPSSLLSENNATVTHGHPKGMAEFGGTFSFADVNNMLNSNWAEHRATASGQGEMNYIMRRTSKSNAKGLRNQINKDINKLKSNINDTYTKSYKQSISAGKTRTQAMHIARQKAVGSLNKYYKDTLPKYGYEYITRKEEYKYGR